MAVSVRRAERSELGEVRDLVNASWLSTYPTLIGLKETEKIIAVRHSMEQLEKQFNSEDAWFFVAEDNGVIAGHLYAFRDEGIYVDRLHARPDFKGRGVGTALLDELAGHARDERVWLDVLKGNSAALGFYLARNFKTVRETDACGGLAGIPAIVLERL